MATLLEQYDLRNDAALVKRVEASIAKTAQYIISTEPSSVANHRNRMNWAKHALQQPQSYAGTFAWAVAGNVTIQDAYTGTQPIDTVNILDSDIDYVVGATVDIFAGG